MRMPIMMIIRYTIRCVRRKRNSMWNLFRSENRKAPNSGISNQIQPAVRLSFENNCGRAENWPDATKWNYAHEIIVRNPGSHQMCVSMWGENPTPSPSSPSSWSLHIKSGAYTRTQKQSPFVYTIFSICVGSLSLPKKRRKYQGQCYDKIRWTGKKKKTKHTRRTNTPICARTTTETVLTARYIHDENNCELAAATTTKAAAMAALAAGAATATTAICIACVCECVHKNTSQSSWISDMENAEKRMFIDFVRSSRTRTRKKRRTKCVVRMNKQRYSPKLSLLLNVFVHRSISAPHIHVAYVGTDII